MDAATTDTTVYERTLTIAASPLATSTNAACAGRTRGRAASSVSPATRTRIRGIRGKGNFGTALRFFDLPERVR